MIIILILTDIILLGIAGSQIWWLTRRNRHFHTNCNTATGIFLETATGKTAMGFSENENSIRTWSNDCNQDF